MSNLPNFSIAAEDFITHKLINGKKLAKLIQLELKQKISAMAVKPGLVAVIIGDDPASQIYVRNKEEAANECGFYSQVVRLKEESSHREVLEVIENLNNDSRVHGILVQLPLPKHLDEEALLNAIKPEKDADGFHIYNAGRLFTNKESVVPCTPLGVAVMLKNAGFALTGLHAVVVGRSNIVGKPMAQLLLDEFQCTVTVCHSRTQNLSQIVAQADVLVIAVGRRGVVLEKDIKGQAIVVDVGIHRLYDADAEKHRVCGDIDYEKALDKVKAITPVPGGVGPMTIAMLLYNTMRNAEKILSQLA